MIGTLEPTIHRSWQTIFCQEKQIAFLNMLNTPPPPGTLKKPPAVFVLTPLQSPGRPLLPLLEGKTQLPVASVSQEALVNYLRSSDHAYQGAEPTCPERTPPSLRDSVVTLQNPAAAGQLGLVVPYPTRRHKINSGIYL